MIYLSPSLVPGGLEFFQRSNQRDINMDQPFVRQRYVCNSPSRRHVQEIGMGNFDWRSARVVDAKWNERLGVPGLPEFFDGHGGKVIATRPSTQAT